MSAARGRGVDGYSELIDEYTHMRETGMEIEAYDGDYTLSNGYGTNAKLPPIQIKEADETEVIERYNDGAVKTAAVISVVLTTFKTRARADATIFSE